MPKGQRVTRQLADDGSDWGCHSTAANNVVAETVREARRLIQEQSLRTDDAIVAFIRPRLQYAGDGATDTVVKESVFMALDEAIEEAGIPFDDSKIYGW